MSSSEKVVQTKLPKKEYERLVRIAERKEKSLKQLLRDAANEYTERHEKIDTDDPFFNVDIDKSGTDQKTAKNTDEYLYRE
ncbi:MAG: hypothetical protein ABEK59_03615 [Halobacteria archaeon]